MNKNIDSQKFEALYFQITDIWKRLCEEHNLLLDQTCEEYSLLLGSEIDLLEKKTSEKEQTIQRIQQLEKLRAKLIATLDDFNPTGKKVTSITEVIRLFEPFEKRNDARHLFRFNQFLIDIIEKIQVQNKKNQLFINKALANLKQIREQAMGIKSYSTYNKQGGTRNVSLDNR